MEFFNCCVFSPKFFYSSWPKNNFAADIYYVLTPDNSIEATKSFTHENYTLYCFEQLISLSSSKHIIIIVDDIFKFLRWLDSVINIKLLKINFKFTKHIIWKLSFFSQLKKVIEIFLAEIVFPGLVTFTPHNLDNELLRRYNCLRFLGKKFSLHSPVGFAKLFLSKNPLGLGRGNILLNSYQPNINISPWSEIFLTELPKNSLILYYDFYRAYRFQFQLGFFNNSPFLIPDTPILEEAFYFGNFYIPLSCKFLLQNPNQQSKLAVNSFLGFISGVEILYGMNFGMQVKQIYFSLYPGKKYISTTALLDRLDSLLLNNLITPEMHKLVPNIWSGLLNPTGKSIRAKILSADTFRAANYSGSFKLLDLHKHSLMLFANKNNRLAPGGNFLAYAKIAARNRIRLHSLVQSVLAGGGAPILVNNDALFFAVTPESLGAWFRGDFLKNRLEVVKSLNISSAAAYNFNLFNAGEMKNFKRLTSSLTFAGLKSFSSVCFKNNYTFNFCNLTEGSTILNYVPGTLFWEKINLIVQAGPWKNSLDLLPMENHSGIIDAGLVASIVYFWAGVYFPLTSLIFIGGGGGLTSLPLGYLREHTARNKPLDLFLFYSLFYSWGAYKNSITPPNDIKLIRIVYVEESLILYSKKYNIQNFSLNCLVPDSKVFNNFKLSLTGYKLPHL